MATSGGPLAINMLCYASPVLFLLLLAVPRTAAILPLSSRILPRLLVLLVLFYPSLPRLLFLFAFVRIYISVLYLSF